MTDDQKDAEFAKFKESPEMKILDRIFAARTGGDKKNEEIKALQNGTEDITGDWGPILQDLHDLVELLRVPGKKSKSKLHI